MHRISAAVVVGIVLSGAAHAWISTPDERRGDGRAIALFSDGDVVMTATYGGIYSDSSDLAVIRLDGTTGAVVWRTDFGTGAAEDAIGVEVDSSDDVITVDRGRSSVTKLDGATGVVLWDVPFPGTAHAFALDPQGDVVVGGSDISGNETVVKYSGGSGAMSWTASPQANATRALTIDARGDIFIASTRSIGGALPPTTQAVFRELSGVDGSSLWDIALPFLEHVQDTAVATALDAGGRFVALINSYQAGLSEHDPDIGWWTVASADAASGQLLWEIEIPAAVTGYGVGATSLATALDGTVYAAGSLPNSQGRSGLAVLAIDGATGAEIWRHTLAGSGINVYSVAHDVAVGPDGAVVATGRTVSRKGRTADLLVTSLRPRDGHALWRTEVNLNPQSQYDDGAALVVDSSGTIAVAGTLVDPSYRPVCAAVKLRSNGTSFEGPVTGLKQRPRGVVVRESPF